MEDIQINLSVYEANMVISVLESWKADRLVLRKSAYVTAVERVPLYLNRQIRDIDCIIEKIEERLILK